MVKIDNDVPVPELRYGKLPFEKMKPGNSFVAPISIKIIHSRMHYYSKKLGWEFTARKIDDKSCRVWRIK